MLLPKPKPRPRKLRRWIRTRRPPGTKRREAKAAGQIDPLQWDEVVRFYGGLCAFDCGKPWKQQAHCKALGKEGRHEIGNVAPACEPCNMRQGQLERWPTRRHPWMPRT